MTLRKRLPLAHLPTPLQRPRRLAVATGIDLWVKRDDMTGGAEAGNKIRKLEFLLGAALSLESDTVITCGGLQSNHARATALAAASLGLRAVLFLRSNDPSLDPTRAPLEGNVLIDRLAGAEIRLISPEQYRDRERILDAAAEELRREGHKPYVIPEGGSNGLGALGYVEAMGEVRRQLDLGLGGGKAFDAIVVACGSGGTAAGAALGAALYGVASEVVAVAVCDDAPTFQARIEGIVREARALDPRLPEPTRVTVDDAHKGPAYAVSTPEQRRLITSVAGLSGMVLDPVYTGKAFSALMDLAGAKGPLAGKRILFVHTGGLPGLLAQGATFQDALGLDG
ncbi:pyridoxal-phosphate dependent enzyme [Polyangium spumosum]|uniref:Pyridoxal-phosphate dependent enzyme n=1 Tax=Polyangium spumosum TaxID=889282 RepID=A0A6N7PQD9_9BACT|nr:pyridoxal-phosphate dependent enzyme [Polyangium spumosum]MRG92425.1 pyridoxal-phosphate dependent enzyme [Polyangium spumosum]